MTRWMTLVAAILLTASVSPRATRAQSGSSIEPDYSFWTTILQKYSAPAKGVDYAALRARDAGGLQKLRQQLGSVNVANLNHKQQLAYWINVYNVNVVATIVEHYPVESIRDISTDPIIRLNVFKKERVPLGSAKLSLDQIENEKIRDGFHDPRIHFAINCAARSCPPIRPEAYNGANVDAQLDDQVRRFLNGPLGVRFGRKGHTLLIHVTKIMEWFGDDFQKWGGGKVAFFRRYLTPDQQQLIDQARGKIDLEYDDYDWSLNDWKR